MMLRNPVLFELKGLPATREADDTLHMDQAQFRALYDQTAKPVWAFLFRRTGNEHLADDLLQETYYRFLRMKRDFENAAHRRNYLFRIAANVANDALRKKTEPTLDAPDDAERLVSQAPDAAALARKKTDLARAMSVLSERQRQALWLAYAEGMTHREIAGVLGMRTGSVRPMLFRARARLASLLRGDVESVKKDESS
jgi:RNA polymerase sigma-70 factor, ECF subfamily